MSSLFFIAGFTIRTIARSITFALAITVLLVARSAPGQAAESANTGRAFIWAGAGISGYHVSYGDRRLVGITATVDADTVRHIGVEGEINWLDFHQQANVHVETYEIGPRYHLNLGDFQPYAKGLIGIGRLNFPYNSAYGRYLVLTPGAGLDYRLNSRWSIRALDFEYQVWPQFEFGTLTSAGISSGIRFRVF